MAVYVRGRLKRTRFNQARLVRLAEQILSAAGESSSELSIELIGDRRMRRLNRVYRRKDRTTDVLAFPMREACAPRLVRRAWELLGDVVISVPTALRQAREAGRTVEDELVALLVHGVLHLCGYDHERNKKEAARMHRREQSILQSIRPVPSLVTRCAERRKRSR
jgi:rRNA maturation RNase YbeY